MNDRRRERAPWPRGPTSRCAGTSSCSPTTSSTASAAWAKACRSRSPRTAGASSGSRTRARRRISPPSTCPTRASPRWSCQTDLPQRYMRSNSLELTGDIMAVAYQTQKVGQKPAGFELFDISVPEKPKSIAFVDCSGPYSRGVHQLWFCDGEYVHMARRRARLQAEPSARRPVLPLLRRAQSVEAGRGRPLVAAGHARGRQRGAAAAPPGSGARQGLPRPQHQRLSAAARPLLSRLSRRRHVHPRHLRQGESQADLPAGTTRRRTPASPTRCCRCSTASC